MVNSLPVNNKRDDSTTTIWSYSTTNIVTVYQTVHQTNLPTPSSAAASLSSAISAEKSSVSASITSSPSSSVSHSPASSASSTSTSKVSSSTTSSSSGFYSYPKDGLKGVNLGGWLLLEPWINTDLFNNDVFTDGNIPVDEFNFCEKLGNDKAAELLEKHYSSWITEDDFKQMAKYGLNAVRIPIGYWAYKLMSTDKYYKGGQDSYLEKAIGWAKNHNMYVMIDLHGAPGSQNGYESSGHSNFYDWNKYDNQNQTAEVLKIIFDKYGGDSYKDVVVGIELVNEPLIGGSNAVSQDILSGFYSKVVDEVNGKQNIVLHDGYLYQGAWTDKHYNSDNIIYDTHLYMLYDAGYIAESYDDKIQQVCKWGEEIGALSYKELVGEFTAAWDSNSSSIYTQKIDKWGDDDKKKIRKFVEAQLTAFEKSYGWFFWNWKMGASDQWNFQILVENGIIPQPLSDRQYTTC